MSAQQENPEASSNTNTILLQKLHDAVNGHAAAATFACGGSVPIAPTFTGDSGQGPGNLSSSVTIRWDGPSSADNSKVSFPLPDVDKAPNERFELLLQHCEPATFGLGSRDVLDESYRKALKLDNTAFSTNFHPHDCGLLDAIHQILLPSTIKNAQGIGIGPQGVRAELYKLNVYSGPSGKFRSHVDTPRGLRQFGSLVVSLPCAHEDLAIVSLWPDEKLLTLVADSILPAGGTLRVTHRGSTVDFPWADQSPNKIQWAAFYGDCEHEVLEVTSGHRVTLTYNLHYSTVGNLAVPVADPHMLPLYKTVRSMLQEPLFMEQGGYLGFFCHHQYAHSQESGRRSIPGALKGVDLAVFLAFHTLGLRIGIHPILKNRSHSWGGMSARKLMHGPRENSRLDGDYVEQFLKGLDPEIEARDANEDENETDHDEYDEYDDYGRNPDLTTIVGEQLHGVMFDEEYEECSREPVKEDAWPHSKVPRIQWMNKHTHKDFALAGLAYGNEVSLAYHFSAAAILVIVPPSTDRRLSAAGLASLKKAQTCNPPSDTTGAQPSTTKGNNAAGIPATDPGKSTGPAPVTPNTNPAQTLVDLTSEGEDMSE